MGIPRVRGIKVWGIPRVRGVKVWGIPSVKGMIKRRVWWQPVASVEVRKFEAFFIGSHLS